MFREKVTKGAIVNVPSLNDPLVGLYPEAAKLGVPAKPKVAGSTAVKCLAFHFTEEAR